MKLRAVVAFATFSPWLWTDASSGEAEVIASLDTEHQAAVEKGDWQAMVHGYLRAHARGVEIRLRPGIDAHAAGQLSTGLRAGRCQA